MRQLTDAICREKAECPKRDLNPGQSSLSVLVTGTKPTPQARGRGQWQEWWSKWLESDGKSTVLTLLP